MNSKWRMTSPQLAGVALGLFVILAIALAFSRSSCSSAPTTITVDTVYIDTLCTPKKLPKAKKSKKDKDKNPPNQPQQRNYRDEIVS